MTTPDPLKKIVDEANQCVKCGLCLPHCPTYLQTLNEGHSPRGRIALLKGLAQQTLTLTQSTQTYLDHCLTCRACEAVCPSQVAYGQLIDHGRTLIRSDKHYQKPTRLQKTLLFSLKYKKLWRFLAHFVRFFQATGLANVLQKTGLLSYFGLARANDYLLQMTFRPFNDYYPATTDFRENVALFTGCVSSIIDQTTLTQTIEVLTRLGFGVYVPKKQGCCGALHLHAGQKKAAWQLAKRNAYAFAALNIQTIISTATGCQVALKEYAKTFSETSQNLASLSEKIMDITTFVHHHAPLEKLHFRPIPKKIVLHSPCSHRNVIKQANAVTDLLNRIPELTIFPLQLNQHCCGAAGTYFLEHPKMADDLVSPIVEEIMALSADYMVTTNIGCALHLTKALKDRGCLIAIIHPMQLIFDSIYTSRE